MRWFNLVTLLILLFAPRGVVGQVIDGTAVPDEGVPLGGDVVNMVEGNVPEDSPFYTGPDEDAGQAGATFQTEHLDAATTEQSFRDSVGNNEGE